MLINNIDLTDKIIRCALCVHSELGPGLLESIYEEAMSIELHAEDLQFVRQVELPVIYKGEQLNGRFRVDMLIQNSIVLELKAVEFVLPVHKAQVLSYMKLGGWKTGLLLNFNVSLLKDGIQRFILN